MMRLECDPLAAAHQAFLQAVRGWWATDLYRQMHSEDRRLASIAYVVFCALESAMQDAKYSSQYGLIRVGERNRAELIAALDSIPAGRATLTSASDADLPEYFASVDFHHHEGGTTGRPEAGFVYEAASGTTTRMLDKATDMHARFARGVAQLVDGPKPAILDAGCGFGKSTAALARALPDAELSGLDISEPLLRLALLRARESNLDIRYQLGKIEAMPYPDDSFDVVCSSMVIHELPPDILRRFLRECHRVLRRGGHVYCLDFYVLPETDLAEALHRGHSRRNAEPYMEELYDLELPAELTAAGLAEVDIRSLAQADPQESWSLPWTQVVAYKR